MSGPDHLPHLVTHSRTQLPLLRKSRLVSDEQETNCYNGCQQDGHREKSCGENHALSIAMFIYCTHQTEGGSIVMSRCQSVFLITGEPCSKWQLSCTVVNMVTMLHPLLCSDWLIAQREYVATCIREDLISGTLRSWVHLRPKISLVGLCMKTNFW